MKDPKQEFDYLLDDDEFAKVMAYRYNKDGKPRDALVAQRVWNSLSHALGMHGKKKRWVYSLSLLAAVALLLIFVKPAGYEEPLPSVKSEGSRLDLSVEWVGSAMESNLKVRTAEPRWAVLYASDDKGQRVRVHEPFSLKAHEERLVPLTLDPARTWSRICALTATSAAELERLESMLDLVWPQIGEQQCVTR